jgi:hypothetical protein
MVPATLAQFDEVWLVDFEFSALPGERQTPICLVGHSLAGQKIRVWEDDLLALPHPPYPTDSDTLFVAYYASAEMRCHLNLCWPLPVHVLDLYAEFRCATNGLYLPSGSGLVGALTAFGLDSIGAEEKDTMRQLAMRGGPWTAQERADLLDYCESDVIALERLLSRMLPEIDLPRALLRGRFMAAAAQIEYTGVPIDTDALATLRQNWRAIQERLIDAIDADYGVYEGRTFKVDQWAAWLARNGIPWPRLASGHLALDSNTFKEMARIYPSVAPIKELRTSLSQLKLHDLAVGSDDRNRCLLSAFRARTSRNQPSASQSVFGPAVWIRGLIRPSAGDALAYVDWSQQEFGIAAALSGDRQMQEAYLSGDAYLAFGKQAGLIPPEGTKETHKLQRERCKACVLGTQYGIGVHSLAQRLNQSPAHARELLLLHRKAYPDFWKWSDLVVDFAMLHGYLRTCFGWRLHVTSLTKATALRNFLMQAHGAEILRLACILATEQGIEVAAPVHDALLVVAPLERIEAVVVETQKVMAQAGEIVLDGFQLRSEAKIVRHPDRYMDPRGEVMWARVWKIIEELENDE